MEDFDREIKVLLVGNGGVGKTSMIRRFCKGVWTDEYKKTIGVDFLEKPLFVDSLGEEVRFMLWDTGGCVNSYSPTGASTMQAYGKTNKASIEPNHTHVQTQTLCRPSNPPPHPHLSRSWPGRV